MNGMTWEPLWVMPPACAKKTADTSVVLATSITLYRNPAAEKFLDAAALEKTAAHLPDYTPFSKMAPQTESTLRCSGLLPPVPPAARLHAGAAMVEADTAVVLGLDDQITIRSVAAGWNCETPWQRVRAAQDALEEHVTYAFSPDFGFLTRCPVHAGIAMHAVTHLFLPGLWLWQQQEALREAATACGFAFAGIDKDGRIPFAVLGNQATLGLSEEEMLRRLSTMVQEIRQQEEQARAYWREHPLRMDDKIATACARLASARLVTEAEAVEHLAWLRWQALETPAAAEAPALENVDRALMAAFKQNGTAFDHAVESDDVKALRAEQLRNILAEKPAKRKTAVKKKKS